MITRSSSVPAVLLVKGNPGVRVQLIHFWSGLYRVSSYLRSTKQGGTSPRSSCCASGSRAVGVHGRLCHLAWVQLLLHLWNYKKYIKEVILSCVLLVHEAPCRLTVQHTEGIASFLISGTSLMLLHITGKCLWEWGLGETSNSCLALRSCDKARKYRKCDSFQSFCSYAWCRSVRTHVDSLPVKIMKRGWESWKGKEHGKTRMARKIPGEHPMSVFSCFSR